MSNGEDEERGASPQQRSRSPEDSKGEGEVSFPQGNAGDYDPDNLFRQEGGLAAATAYLYGEEAELKADSVDTGIARFKACHPQLLELAKNQDNLGSGDETWIAHSDSSWQAVKNLAEGEFRQALDKGKGLLDKWNTAATSFFGRRGAAADTPSMVGLQMAYGLYQAHITDVVTQLNYVMVLASAYSKLTPALMEKLEDPPTVNGALGINGSRLLDDYRAHSQSLSPRQEPQASSASKQASSASKAAPSASKAAPAAPTPRGASATPAPPISILKKEPAASRVDKDLQDQEEHRRFTLRYLERLQQRPPEGDRREAGRAGDRGGGGGGPPDGQNCGICGSPDHQQDRCPFRFPTDGRGPYCSRCGKRGHQEWDCPHRPNAPPCGYCGEYGHTRETCPLSARRERRLRDELPARSMEESRLALKAGYSAEPPDDVSDLEEPPQENPRVTFRRQLRRDRLLQQEQAIERVSREETRQQQILLADLPRIRKELMFVITTGRCEHEYQLTEDQKKKLEEAMIQVYTNQLARPSGRGPEEAHSSASLRELGVDHITKFNGLEHKYAIKLFLAKFEEIRSFKKWNSQVSAAALGQLLDGTALDFYDNYKKQFPPGARLEYIPLRDALLTQFYQKFTLSEKTKMMTNLKYDVARHRSHIHFMTECQKQSFLIYDRGPTMDNETELITRRQAREEMVLMFFVAGCAPVIRHEIEYSRAETKGQIEEAIRRKEEAIRAQDTSGRHDLEPGYHVKEITLEQIEAEMTALQYPAHEINAVMRAKGARQGDRAAPVAELTCYYCELPGHRRSECPTLKRDQGRNQVRADKCGPNVGTPPAVDALAKKGRPRTVRKGGTSKRKDKPTKPRSRRVNEVDLEGDSSTEGESSGSEEEGAEGDRAPREASQPPWVAPGWAPPWPMYWPCHPPTAPREPASEEALQAAEITRQGVRKVSPYDLL